METLYFTDDADFNSFLDTKHYQIVEIINEKICIIEFDNQIFRCEVEF